MKCCFAIICVAMALVCPAASAKFITEKYDNGKTKAKYSTNISGEIHGTYTEYHEDGRTIKTKAKFKNGKFNGLVQTYDANKKLLNESQWLNGRCIFPKTQRFMDAELKKMDGYATANMKDYKGPDLPDAPSTKDLTRALSRTMQYRFVTGVPYKHLKIDPEYVNYCQHASRILVKLGKLDHHPKKPAGMDDESFKLGYKGTSQSNLAMGNGISSSVDQYMDDSDPSNIDRLGHRRWVINPSMSHTGFGKSGRFSAMYAFSKEWKDVPDYDFVAFPPPGYTPKKYFSSSYAWHISLNPQHYATPGKNATLTIYPVDKRLKRGKPLAIEYKNVDGAGFGIKGAIIAKPQKLSMKKGTLYEVEVTGLQPKGNKPATIHYLVSFY